MIRLQIQKMRNFYLYCWLHAMSIICMYIGMHIFSTLLKIVYIRKLQLVPSVWSGCYLLNSVQKKHSEWNALLEWNVRLLLYLAWAIQHFINEKQIVFRKICSVFIIIQMNFFVATCCPPSPLVLWQLVVGNYSWQND